MHHIIYPISIIYITALKCEDTLTVFRNSIALSNTDSQIESNGDLHKVEDVSFVDDVTVLVVDDAHGIIDKVTAVTTIAVNTLCRFRHGSQFFRR